MRFLLKAVLTARSAFAGHLPTAAGDALGATEHDGLGIATLSVRRGQRALLEQRIVAAFGILLPDGPQRHTAGDTSVLGAGPGRWLVMGQGAGNALSSRLKSAVGDCASVTDQSDAYAVVRLAGPAIRDTLAKLVPIDVHARAFRVGDVAATVLAHMGALLYRLEDGAEGQPVFEVAVFRSYAASLWQEISAHS